MATTSALDLARAKRAEMTAAGIKVQVKNPLEKLADMPTSLRRAITAKCYHRDVRGAGLRPVGCETVPGQGVGERPGPDAAPAATG